jgi:hypothetical protein
MVADGRWAVVADDSGELGGTGDGRADAKGGDVSGEDDPNEDIGETVDAAVPFGVRCAPQPATSATAIRAVVTAETRRRSIAPLSTFAALNEQAQRPSWVGRCPRDVGIRHALQ